MQVLRELGIPYNWIMSDIIHKSLLFGSGGFNGQPMLSDVLRHHRDVTLKKIATISNLNELTDDFLVALVKDSLVDPLVFDFEGTTYEQRTENIPAEWFSFSFNVEPGRRYPKTVTRIFIPFTGDRTLVEHTPDTFTMTRPIGEVSGNRIQYDIILWGTSEDQAKAKSEIAENRRLIETYSGYSLAQVKKFNESLPEQVKSAFQSKFDELSKQVSIFTELGLKAEVRKTPAASKLEESKAKKAKVREPQVVIQFVMNQYVAELNQTNNNAGGDVNNAIQSNQ